MLKITFNRKIIARKFAAFGFSYYLCTEILMETKFPYRDFTKQSEDK